MYEFHHNCIKAKYDCSAKLLLTEKRSLGYEKFGTNLFDFSNQVIGKIKDEVKEFLLMSFLD